MAFVALSAPDVTFAAEGGAAAEQSQEDVAAALMASFQFAFHWEDVPEDIARWDLASVPLRQGDDIPPWGRHATPLACGVDTLTPGVVADQARNITCPVLIAQGVRDVVPRPHSEPSVYSGSADITVFTAPRMAHMHNFASARELFWTRIHAWAESVRPAQRTINVPPSTASVWPVTKPAPSEA